MKFLRAFTFVVVSCLLVLSCSSYVPLEEDSGVDNADGVHEGESLCVELDWSIIDGRTQHLYLGWPECAETDGRPVNAWIVRDLVCYEKGNSIDPLPEPPDFEKQEIIVLCDPFGGCGWDIEVVSALNCDNSIEIDYHVLEPCMTCDGVIQMCIFIVLPNDPKPVNTHAMLVAESPCQ